MITPLMMPATAMIPVLIQAIALDGALMTLVTALRAVIIIPLTSTTLRMMQMILQILKTAFWMWQACLILVTVML